MQKVSIQEAINTAKQDPNSAFARQLRRSIESGALDQAAAKQGVDLAPFGRPTTTPDVVITPEFKGGSGVGQGVQNILGGAVEGFSSIGRTVQDILPKSLSTVPDFNTGEAGTRASEATREERLTQVGANPDAFTTKAGEFGGEVAAFATPGGASMKAPQLTYRAATGGGLQALQSGEVDEDSLIVAAVSAFAPPALTKAASAVAKLATNAAKGAGGFVSGQGTEVIEAIYKNPEAARAGMRGFASIADDAATVRTAVKNLSKQASDEFGEALDNLPKRLGRAPVVTSAGGKTTIKVDGKKYDLSLQGVKTQLTQALKKFDVDVDPKKKSFSFTEAPLDNAESKRLQEVFSVIDTWKDTTPKGFHKLARKIDTFRRPGEQSAELNSIIDSVSRNTRNYIKKRIPAAKEMLDKYASAKDVIATFDQEFATKGSMLGGTPERIKTERKLGTLFSGEKTTAKQTLTDEITGGADIIGRQAGRMVQENVPRSQASIGDFLRSAVNLVITPKAVGEVAALLGTTAPKAEQILIRLQKLDPAARALMLQITDELTNLSEDNK